MRKGLFIVLALATLLPFVQPWMALLCGIALALLGWAAFPMLAKSSSRLLMQSAVVLFGLSADLHVIRDAGLTGVGFSIGTIVATTLVGFGLGRLLGTQSRLTALLCAGTSICGGSAIAATGPAIRATDTQMSVALACVFVLNAVALLTFPTLGHALGMEERAFGAWAAVAIHDVSSVVGAARAYGPLALSDAIIIKLTRALWIVPLVAVLTLLVARADRRAALQGTPMTGVSPVKFSLLTVLPWFIIGFVLAATLRTFVPMIGEGRFDWGGDKLLSLSDVTKFVGTRLMTVALLLIGAGLSRAALAKVGWRPFAQAVGMWVCICLLALLAVRGTVGAHRTGESPSDAAAKVWDGVKAPDEGAFFEEQPPDR
ncbi:MAG: YeiH family protein [Phycisphaerales bacterium]